MMKAKKVDGDKIVLKSGIARIQSGKKGLTVYHYAPKSFLQPQLSLNDCLTLINHEETPFEICTVIFEHAGKGGVVYQYGNYGVGQWYFHGKTTGLY